MKWNRDNIVRRARIELRNGEKAIREQLDILREKADREIDRHAKDSSEGDESTTAPSGKSTGVLYGASPETTAERVAHFVPTEVANDADSDQGSPDNNAASVPLLADIDSHWQDPPPLSISERLVPFAEPQPGEAAVDATTVLPLVDVGPGLPDLSSQQCSVEQASLYRLENLDSGAIDFESPIASSVEPFVGSSRAMPMVEVVPPARSALAASTETPTGSHTRRTWSSEVPSIDWDMVLYSSISRQTSSALNQSTPSSMDTYSVSDPPTLIKVTGYRMLNTAVVLILGIWKGVASYRGESILSNTLDILMGVVFAIGLYWLGFLETSDPPCLVWLFHKDYAAPLRRLLTRQPPIPRRTTLVSLPTTSHEV